MGLLGKSFTSKFKTITTLAVSRIAILRNHHKARASYAHSDVAQLLNLGYHDRALLRVEQWIAEQNMLDVFDMIEYCCNFLRERAEVLEKNMECPFELKEATSSLIFASSRCGEFPELHKIKEILTSKFGKEFADHAVELHKNNRVNSKMIQKLSPRRPAMEIKMKALEQIATEIGVTLHLERDPTLINMGKLNVDQRQGELEVETRKWSSTIDDPNPKHKENNQDRAKNIIQDKDLSYRNEERKSYKYAAAAAAALEALESASIEIEACKNSNHTVALRKVHVLPMVSYSSKQKDEVISKSNHSIDLKEMDGNTEKVSKENMEENTNRQSNMLGELGSVKSLDNNNDHQTQFDAATENEHLNEERAHPSSQAIRWNPQRSQADPAVNPMVRRPANMIETTGRRYYPKQIDPHHEHGDWKRMSVRTR